MVFELFRWPKTNEWMWSGAVSLAFALLAIGFGFVTGFFRFGLAEPDTLLRTAVVAFVLPALLEEFVFRGPLVWFARRGSERLWLASGVSLLLFVLWHPFNATFMLTDAQEVFFDWRFLAIATGLGAAATALALRTRTLWPPILFHWLAVLGWKAFLGAPTLL